MAKGILKAINSRKRELDRAEIVEILKALTLKAKTGEGTISSLDYVRRALEKFNETAEWRFESEVRKVS